MPCIPNRRTHTRTHTCWHILMHMGEILEAFINPYISIQMPHWRGVEAEARSLVAGSLDRWPASLG